MATDEDFAAFNPRIASDNSGNMVAIWQENSADTGLAKIFTSVLLSGGSWSTSAQLSPSGHDAKNPEIAMNTSGDAVAVWIRGDPTFGNGALYASFLALGDSWTTPELISSSTDDIAADFKLIMDSTGRIVVIWKSGNNFKIWIATAQFGGTWVSPLQLSNN